MEYKFFDDNIQANYIKALLENSMIPKYKIVNQNSWIVRDNVYIYDHNIIKCTKSGKVTGSIDNSILCNNKTIVCDRNLLCGTSDILAEYIYLDQYNPQTLPRYLYKNFISKCSFYDPETHVFLGEYLRFIRDIYGVDLMPFYNCYSGSTIDNLCLLSDGYQLKTDNNFKHLVVPIKFNKKYTIAIDSEATVRLKSVFYNSSGLVRTNITSDSVQLTDALNDPVKNYSHTSFHSPIIYEINIDSNIDDSMAKIYEQFESELKLIIQVPASNNSSVVVLEGDYTLSPLEISPGDADIKLPKELINRCYCSSPSLLHVNDNINRPFSSRLIEYLLFNVISPLDSIEGNVGYTQFMLKSDYRYVNNIWSDTLRFDCYDNFMSESNINKFDINGFVDKDIEKLITKTYSKNMHSNSGWIRSGG